MFARIYQPSKTAMSSGNAKTKFWVLEYSPNQGKQVDPLMGWTSSDDTQSQVSIKFDTKDAALAYAKANYIVVSVHEPQTRKVNVREGGYGENFATNRRGVWTH